MSDSEEQITAINLDHSVHILRQDGVLEVTFVDFFYGIKELTEIKEAHKRICGNRKFAMLGISSEFSNIDKEGREFLASNEGEANTFAQAFVIKTLAQRILANFYLRFNKPTIPTRFFTKKEDAEQWLAEEIKKFNG